VIDLVMVDETEVLIEVETDEVTEDEIVMHNVLIYILQLILMLVLLL